MKKPLAACFSSTPVVLGFALCLSGTAAFASPTETSTSTTGHAFARPDLQRHFDEQLKLVRLERDALEQDKRDLKVVETRILARIEELKAVLGEVKAQPSAKDLRIRRLAEMAAKMPPERAAKLLVGLNNVDSASILEVMPDRSAASVLAAMDPAQAADLSARYITRASTAPQPVPPGGI